MDLPEDLCTRCRNALRKCDEFSSDQSLQTVFITQELRPFQKHLPTADRLITRVDLVINYLLEQRLATGEWVFPVFLRQLGGRYDKETLLHTELIALADLVERHGSDTTPDDKEEPPCDVVEDLGFVEGDQQTAPSSDKVRKPSGKARFSPAAIVFMSLGLIIIVILIIFKPIAFIQSMLSPEFTIATPQNVVICTTTDLCHFDVEGTYTGRKTGRQLVVFVNPEPGKSDSWYQHKNFEMFENNTWRGQALIGYQACWPAEDDFQIVALVMKTQQFTDLQDGPQTLPKAYTAKSEVIDLVTAYDSVDLSQPLPEFDSAGSSIQILNAEPSRVAFEYDLGTGDWVQISVPLQQTDITCLRAQGGYVTFSWQGSGAVNSIEVKLTDRNKTNFGWLGIKESTKTQTFRLAVDTDFEYWWGNNEMDWSQVQAIWFAVTRKEGGEGGKGRITIEDLRIAP